MERLRIAVDPALTEHYGSEIHWTWRLLLTLIGWSWEERWPPNGADVAYVCDARDAPEARMCIVADAEAWRRPKRRLIALQDPLGLPMLRYEGQGPRSETLLEGSERLLCHHDLVFDAFWLATGQGEVHLDRGPHGFAILEGTPILRDGMLRRPPVSRLACWLAERLDRPGLSRKPLWPDGRAAAASATHDVDYPEVVRWLEPARILWRRGAEGLHAARDVALGRRHHWHMTSWLREEEPLGVSSAFFISTHRGSLIQYALGTPDNFYDARSRRFRALYPLLREHGCEIGLHASYNAYQSVERLAQEREALVQLTGAEVQGNRHHYWHLCPDAPEDTLHMHEQVGFLYDSSLIHDHHAGWRHGLCHPYLPFHTRLRRELQTLQIPPAWMDEQVFSHAHGNGSVARDTPDEVLGVLAEANREYGGCFVSNLHDYVYDDVLYPGRAGAWKRLWHRLREQGDTWFATPGEIARHWIDRYRELLAESHGLEQGRC